ncbi:glutamine and serine-rich protein 1 isoform X3 [Hippopotamus amphibius kiboko]|uniref:glutamine and serine-rich protein 1 isoform X3 n=1 Tax=Hippopotamus amphibius kiboko TaxID=575201 RepID=UPI002597C208|nr:glutamine and serine-rich protein 1 isoform X3 [Hippopotamus amphibius kiboko]
MECCSTIKNNKLLEVGTLCALRTSAFSRLPPCATVGDSESQEEVIPDIARQLTQVVHRVKCGICPGLVDRLAAQFMNGSLQRRTRRIYLFNSLSYEEGHPSHSETDLLQRQTFAASHQLPGYATTPQPTGLSGIFDTSVNNASTNTKESSVMNFLSAVESRTAQAASSGTTLLPQFRAPSWQTGMHSSAATELFVTGPLPTTGTLPPSALSAYQHPTTFSNRNFATTSPLVLQDSTFNTTSNGILSPHDPLLQIKTSQGTVPAALAFERLGSSAISNSIPPQSSTYRSAQESAPHLLQPQFSLLPSALGGAQQTPQAYGSTLFTSSTASIERALRECSVIKHHQRPSGTQSIQAQLTGSQHSLHSYLSNASVVNFQETSRQSSLSCSPIGDSTQVSNGGLQQKTSQVSVELAQSYSSAVPSSGYPPSTTKVKSCSTKQPLASAKTPKPQSIIPPVQTLSYSKPLHNQSSVISGQAQIYSTAQLPSLLSVSQSQNYGLVQPHNVPSIVHSQVYRSSKVEKLPSLYKTLAFSGSSQTITAENPTLNYSSNQQEVLSSVTNENYPAQTRDLSSVSQSQSYSSGHSQGLSPVSQTQVSYSSQSQVLSVVSPSESYASGQPLTLTAPSLSYSSASRAQNMPDSSPTQNYISMHSSQNAQTQGSSSPQSQKFLPAVQSSFASSTHCQTLQDNIPSPDPKSYAERKLDSNVYTSSKQEDDFPMQGLQVLQPQVSLESSTQRLSDGEINVPEAAYKVSKADDRYSQSIIRSNSRLEDQVVGIALQGSKKEENIVGSVTQLNQQIGQVSNAATLDIKKTTNLIQTPQIRLNTKDLNQQHSLIQKVHEAKVQEQHGQIINASSQIQIPNNALGHGHQVSLPNTQVLLDSACDLQILQQSILQAGLGQVKASLQVQRVQSPQQIVHPFLQMDGHIIQSNGDHSQQQLPPQSSEIMKMDLSESSKPLQQHLTTKGHFSETNQHDSKNHFVSLGSICFPEAMLLSDERNILSNVDDILAATAAACGVTPSDFSKSTSNETIPAVEDGDSKSHFQQSLDIGHVTSDFNSIAATVGKPPNINDISLNGNQVTVNLSPVPTLQSKMTLDQQHIETPGQNKASKVTSPVVGPGHEVQEQSSGPFKKQSATNHEPEEDSEVPVDSTLSNNRNQEFVSSSRSISGESAASESEFTLGGDDSGVSMNPTRSTLALLAMAQPGEPVSVKTEEENQDLMHFNLQKKKTKGKGQAREEDSSNQKQLKRPAQGKRQNPRGTDLYLPYTSPSSESCHEGYQHQEKMRQKIKEVEEKQPEVKTGFIASFLDFLKSGPKQQFSTLAVRMPNRTRRPGTQTIRTFCPPPLPKTASATPTPLVSEPGGNNSPSEKTDNELKSSEHLSSLSSDEDDPGVCGRDIYKSASTTLNTLDATSDKKKKTVSEALQVATTSPTANTTGTAATSSTTVGAVKQEPLYSTSSAVNILENINSAEPSKSIELDGLPSDQFAKGQDAVAIEGFTDEENTESGGEGQYRERDEFVVKIEDIETFKEALKTGKEPPAIWKVQKALLQKFVPEIRDGQREFAATNSYLGYFGDAKSKYKRIYVKFIENTNKKEYVRVCSKKPKNKPSQTIRTVQPKPSNSSKTSDPPTPKTTTKAPSMKPKVKQLKVKAEPPPKKRKKWKEEFSSSQSDSSPEIHSSSSDDEDELLLPHMKKIDSMLNDNRKRLLLNLHLDQSFKNALESFPELTIITRDSKAKSGGSAISKIKMNGKAYNKKTLRTSKTTTKSAQEFAVDPEKIQLYSLYHSLHHYKYHVYLICKDEISSVQKKNEDLGQEEIVQLCMKNVKWVEDLFEKFGELLNHVQQKCS